MPPFVHSSAAPVMLYMSSTYRVHHYSLLTTRRVVSSSYRLIKKHRHSLQPHIYIFDTCQTPTHLNISWTRSSNTSRMVFFWLKENGYDIDSCREHIMSNLLLLHSSQHNLFRRQTIENMHINTQVFKEILSLLICV